MTLDNLSESLAAIHSVSELDDFVKQYDSQITLALLQLDVSKHESASLLDEICDAFYSSGAGKEFESTGKYTAGIHHFLHLLGITYEKLGHASIKQIASDIQEYSLKRRLKALYAIHHETGFHRRGRGYIKVFTKVLNLLSEARYDSKDTSLDYTGSILRILNQYRTVGEAYLKKYPNELLEFKNLFSDEANLYKWTLLTEYEEPIISLPPSAISFDFSNAVKLPVEPSIVFSDLFARVVSQPLRDDSRTLYGNLSRPLGYDSDYITDDIISHGTADFRQEFETYKGETMSPADRTLLYCHYNLRMHYFSSYYIYSVYFKSLNRDKLGFSEKLFFLDLGCGPLTSGLAIADLFSTLYKTPINMCYIGVDIAPSMLSKAKQFSEDIETDIFSNSEFHFFETFPDAIPLITEKLVMYNHTIIINASYLFASSSLDIEALAAFVTKIHVSCSQASIHIIFQNPNKTHRNTKYIAWKKLLEPSGLKAVIQNIIPIRYRNHIGGIEKKNPEPVYYELLSY